jgi:DNA-binding NtrC family response regulator
MDESTTTPPDTTAESADQPQPKEWRDIIARYHVDLLRDALRAERGHITRTARSLNITRQWLTKLIRFYQLNEFARELRIAAGSKGRALGRQPWR